MFIRFMIKCLIGFGFFLILSFITPWFLILSISFLVPIFFYPEIVLQAEKGDKLCKEVLK